MDTSSHDQAGRLRRHRSLVASAVVGLLAAAGLSAVTVAASPAQAADESLSVDFSVAGAAPTYRASGWIYGMTENGVNPPSNYFTDVHFRYMRAGGAQLSGGGWQGGGYDRRWNATKAQLVRTRALGGEFVLLVHDLWGADGAAISKFPGDNGNWTDYDNFLTRVINDVRATGQPVQWDLWNEPNASNFWNRTQSQYFSMWKRAYDRIRAAFPNQLIVGPSCACVPSSGGWWTQYLDYVKANNAVPDIISWHSLPGDPVANVAAANTSLNSRSIAHPRPYQINEYGASNEQNPGDGSWYIARLERAGADGLRANWASGGNLHNDLGNLLTHNSAGQYSPKGEWWVYKFYGAQTGQTASVTASSNYDAFATKTTGNAKVLVGGGRTTGNIALRLNRLDATSGVVQNNRVRALIQRIPYNSGGAVTGPVTVSDTVVTLSGNATTLNLNHSNADETFTVTLLPPDGTTTTTTSSTTTSSTTTSSTTTSSTTTSSTTTSSTTTTTTPSTTSSTTTTTPGTTTTTGGSGGCTASYAVTSDWGSGFVSNVTVTAGNAATQGWTVQLTLPPGAAITNIWSGVNSGTTGTVTVTNAAYNGALAPGGSASFGFQGTGSGSGATVSCTAR